MSLSPQFLNIPVMLLLHITVWCYRNSIFPTTNSDTWSTPPKAHDHQKWDILLAEAGSPGWESKAQRLHPDPQQDPGQISLMCPTLSPLFKEESSLLQMEVLDTDRKILERRSEVSRRKGWLNDNDTPGDFPKEIVSAGENSTVKKHHLMSVSL